MLQGKISRGYIISVQVHFKITVTQRGGTRESSDIAQFAGRWNSSFSSHHNAFLSWFLEFRGKDRVHMLFKIEQLLEIYIYTSLDVPLDTI